MGVQTEIDRIIGLVHESHEKAQSKGGTTTPPLLANLPGVIESIPQGVELPELGDKAAQPTDIVSGKELYDDQGNPITGTMKAIGFGSLCNIENATIDTTGDGVKNLLIAGKTSNDKRAYADPGTTVVVYAEETSPAISCFGNATKDQALKGATFTSAAGLQVEGNIDTKTDSDLSASGATVTVPAGYYASQATKSVAIATQATPSISVNSSGLITASVTQSAGYVASGTKSATNQLTTRAAQTITPGTTAQEIPAGVYLTGKQTISAVQTQIKTVTANGTFTPDAGKYLSSVTVSIPTYDGTVA